MVRGGASVALIYNMSTREKVTLIKGFKDNSLVPINHIDKKTLNFSSNIMKKHQVHVK